MITTEEIGGMIFKALGVFAWIIAGLVAILIIILAFNWYNRRKRFCYEVRIKKEDPEGSGNLVEVGLDKGGIFLDRKTSNRLFLLKKHQVGLSPDNLPDYQGSGKMRIVELLQLSLKTFRYLGKPRAVSNSPLTMEYSVFDYDVAWATNEVDRLKSYEKKNFLDKIKDVLPIIVVFMLSIIVIYFFLNKFDVLKDVASSMQATAEILKQTIASQSPSQTAATLVGS